MKQTCLTPRSVLRDSAGQPGEHLSKTGGDEERRELRFVYSLSATFFMIYRSLDERVHDEMVVELHKLYEAAATTSPECRWECKHWRRRSEIRKASFALCLELARWLRASEEAVNKNQITKITKIQIKLSDKQTVGPKDCKFYTSSVCEWKLWVQ